MGRFAEESVSSPVTSRASVRSAKSSKVSMEEPAPRAARRDRTFLPMLILMVLASFLLGAGTLYGIQRIMNKSVDSGNGTQIFYLSWEEKIIQEINWLILGRDTKVVISAKPEIEKKPDTPETSESSENPEGQQETTNSPVKTPQKPKGMSSRISKELQIVPESYHLTVQLYLPDYGAVYPKEKELKFDGNIAIHMVAGKPTDTIELHARKLIINKDQSRVIQGIKNDIKIANIEVQEKKVKITLSEKVEAGKFQMELSYVGEISAGLGGLYQSKYTNKDNKQKITAVTQMEPIDARLFVPCFDEPEYKATWDVTIIHPKQTTALANGNQILTKFVEDGFKSTSFATTPKMSSYLLAIFVSDFGSHGGKFSNGTKDLRIWSRPEAVEETQFAIEAGVKSLDCYEKLYGIKFPLPKQDMVALPDFSFGAMENWGLVTYRESALLYNNRTYSMSTKRSIARIIAHELAHMWFGNLVTMKWWNDLWLNEGFATFMEYKGIEKISEHFQADDYVLTSEVSSALDGDSRASSHPLSSVIEIDEEIEESFDSISYKKGCSIIRMIAKVMGDKYFNKGIQAYLSKYSHANTEAINLWNMLDEHKEKNATGPNGKLLNITDLALQWTSQMGYPVLTMVKDGSSLSVTAERFKKNKNAQEVAKYANPVYGFKWDVPLWYEVEGEGVKMTWMPSGGKIDLPATDKAIILNSELSSFIRTNYDEYNWKKIIAALKKRPESFSHRTRYTVIQDAFEMASVDKLSYSLLFELISYAEKETHYLPMSAVMDGLSKLSGFFSGAEESRVLRKYIKNILRPAYELVSLEKIAERDNKESEMLKNLQDIQVFSKYCANKDSGCAAKLVKLFETEVMAKCTNENDIASECSTVSASIRGSVYCKAIAEGGEDVFNKMLELYKKETDPSERNSIQAALTCTKDISTLRFILESILNNSGLFRFQDASRYIFGGVAGNEVGREFILNFMISRWDDLYNTFKSNTGFVTDVISAGTSYIRSEEELKQLQDFIASTPEVSKYHEFAVAIEGAEYRLNWIKKNLKEVTKIMQNLL